MINNSLNKKKKKEFITFPPVTEKLAKIENILFSCPLYTLEH